MKEIESEAEEFLKEVEKRLQSLAEEEEDSSLSTTIG